MPTITKQKLSGSTNGRGIEIVATSTPGTLLHTAVDAADNLDEVWLWATNTGTTGQKVTLELGGVSVPDDIMEFTLRPEDGAYLMVPGWIYDGGVIVRAFCAVANVVVFHGYVNRLDQS